MRSILQIMEEKEVHTLDTKESEEEISEEWAPREWEKKLEENLVDPWAKEIEIINKYYQNLKRISKTAKKAA